MSRRVRLGAIFAGSMIALLVVWFVTLYHPRTAQIAKSQATAVAAQSQADQLQVQVARFKAEIAAAPRLQAELQRLQDAIPNTPNLAQFILDVNDAAQEAGITISTISPSAPALGTAHAVGSTATGGASGAAAPPAIRISLSTTGTFFTLIDFINKLNAMPRLLVVDTFGLSPGGSASTLGTSPSAASPPLSATFAIRMFTTTAASTTTSTTLPTATPPTTVAGSTTSSTGAAG
jgi:Tfp pilus assembly protein PilO